MISFEFSDRFCPNLGFTVFLDMVDYSSEEIDMGIIINCVM